MNVRPRINLIVNPRAGYWRRHPAELRRLLADPGREVKVYPTTSVEELRGLFADGLFPSEPSEPTVDVVAGGDGTLSHFLSCCTRQRRRTPLLVIPTGTINVVAADLELRRSRAWQILEAIRGGAIWRSVPRTAVDVGMGDGCGGQEWRSGFSFETGFCSHVLRDFYAHANLKVNAVAFVLKTILGVVAQGACTRQIKEDGATLEVQSYLASGVSRMLLGLRPFGRAPELPVLATFRLSRWQQRLDWWRVVSGDVAALVRLGALTLRPLREGQTLTLETAEPANLDGEMIAGRPDQVMLIRRGPTVEFIRDLA